MHNPHTILGIEEGDSDEIVKRRYRKVSRMIHPDKHADDPSAVALFQIVKNAYESIKKAKTRMELPVSNESNVRIPKVTQLQQNNGETVNKTKKTHKSYKDTDTLSTKESLVPGTNISENDMRTLAEQIKDPWFHQSFSLTDFFGDVPVPEKKDIRPTSSRR